MATIDAYCEWLLKQKLGQKMQVLPEGLSEEQYLDRLDTLTRNLFAQMTLYSEKDYQTGKAALILIRKFCFSQRIYANAPQSESFSAYSTVTLKMIEDELNALNAIETEDVPMVNAEKLFTIMYNTLQLITSIIHYFTIKKEERIKKTNAKVVGVEIPLFKIDVQKEIDLERDKTELINPIPYLESIFAVNSNFEKSKKNGNSPRKIAGEWAEFKYLSMIFELSLLKIQELEMI